MGKTIEGYLNLTKVQGDFLFSIIDEITSVKGALAGLGTAFNGVTGEQFENEMFNLRAQLESYGFKNVRRDGV